ncbi:MAG: hypothetical protein IKA51_00975 [Clostridia bacterium]|nr:hypothetical protein [Clostridia bacterium]
MKRLFLLFTVAFFAVFSAFVYAAKINKSDIINGKWSYDGNSYSTVAIADSEHSLVRHTLRYGSYNGDIRFNFSTFALNGSNEYSAVYFGSFNKDVFTGIAIKLNASGITVSEYDGDSSLDITPTLPKNTVNTVADNGSYMLNSVTVTFKDGLLSVSVNGKDIISDYFTDAFVDSGNIYLDCNVNSNISVTFTDISETALYPAPVIPSVPESGEAESIPSDYGNDSSQSDMSGIGGGEDLIIGDYDNGLKSVAFFSLLLISIAAVLFFVFSVADLVKRGKN